MKSIPILARFRSIRRLFLTAGLAGAAFAAASDASAQQTIWKGGTGFWSSAGLWNTGVVPNSAGISVFVDGGKTGTHSMVTVDGVFTIGDLTIDAGDNVTIEDNDSLYFDSGNSAASTITNNGTFNLTSTGNITGFNVPGTVMLAGTGTITLVNSAAFAGAGTLNIGAGQTIQGETGGVSLGYDQLTINNAGVINANAANGKALVLDPGAGGFTNTGTLMATSPGVLQLSGHGSGAFTNTGSLIEALDGTSVQLVNGASLTGGTLSTAGTGYILDRDGATITDLTINGTFNIPDNIGLTLVGTITNNGTFNITSTGNITGFNVPGAVTLAGTGTINLVNSAAFAQAGTLNIGAGQTIQGETGGVSLGYDQLTINNAGIIDANATNGNALILDPGAGGFTNTGTLMANGSTLQLSGHGSGTFTNTGSLIEALDRSSVQLIDGAALSGGVLSTAGTGNFLDRDGATLTDLTINGTFNVPDNVGLTLIGTITNNGTINLTSTGSVTSLDVPGAVTLAGTGTINVSNSVAFEGAGTLTIGAGQTIQGETGARSLGQDQLTISNAGVIDANAANGKALIIDPSAGGFTNTGTLMATGPGTLHLSANDVGQTINDGIIDVEAGGTVTIDQNGLSNFSNDVLTGGTYQVNAGASGTATLNLDGGSVPATLTNAATVILSRPNSNLPALQNLTDNQGTLSLLALRQFTTQNDMSNEGTLVLDAGSTLHVNGALTESKADSKPAPALRIVIGGTATQGAGSPGLLQTNGSLILAGTLDLSFSASAALPASTASLVVASANAALSGSFSNAANGARLFTTDGKGSFQVNYGPSSSESPTQVVLTDFINPDDEAPSITSPLSATGTVGKAFTYQTTASGHPTSFKTQGLAGGLGASNTTGKISGTPNAAGTYSVLLSATNAHGTGTATLTLTIQPAAPPAITSATTASATTGTAFSYQITATNSPTKYGESGLPGGLAINQTTGKISGTPTTAGTYSVTIAAFNSLGSGSAKLTLTVKAGTPVITSDLSATAAEGSAFSYQITATNSPTKYGESGLPAGLSINQTTGKISGTPTTPGTSTVTIAAFNAAGSGSAKLTLTINAAAPKITSSLSASATVGKAFSYQITATNNPTKYGESGLPAGLTINQTTGKISGTPTKAGTFTVTIAAFNGTGSGSAKLTLTVK